LATTNISFSPKIGYFFNENSELVLTDITGKQIQKGNPDGWGVGNPVDPTGRTNPSNTSVTAISIFIAYYFNGMLYELSTSNVSTQPLILTGSGFLTSDPYHVVNIADAPYLFDAYGNYIQELQSFSTGLYIIGYSVSGSFIVVADTVNWTSGLSQPRFLAYNLNGSCIPEVFKQVVFNKGCKPNKKAQNVLRYQKMTYDYFNFNSVSSSGEDLIARFEKTNDLYLALQDICDDKRNCIC